MGIAFGEKRLPPPFPLFIHIFIFKFTAFIKIQRLIIIITRGMSFPSHHFQRLNADSDYDFTIMIVSPCVSCFEYHLTSSTLRLKKTRIIQLVTKISLETTHFLLPCLSLIIGNYKVIRKGIRPILYSMKNQK